jgi:hypothetical protein
MVILLHDFNLLLYLLHIVDIGNRNDLAGAEAVRSEVVQILG